MTRTERGCLEQTAERAGAALPELDPAWMGLTKLVIYLLSARLSPRHAPTLVNG